MNHMHVDRSLCEKLFQAFHAPGALPSGGVTRLGYSDTEDEMHAIFRREAESLGFPVTTDEAGNSFAVGIPGAPYTLLGSHLDSVVDGGRYDGVAGVIAGLLVMKAMRDAGSTIPVRTAAFRCEESSNFNHATLGSELITGKISMDELEKLRSRDGTPLTDIFHSRGLQLIPQRIFGLRRYLELHIEQGRFLEEAGIPVGIVSAIAAPRRFTVTIVGMAEHSGATGMELRTDALPAAAELILEVERIGRREVAHQSVATTGIVNNYPNVMNVIPGETSLGVDMRGIDGESLRRMERALRRAAGMISTRRKTPVRVERLSAREPVPMDPSLRASLRKAADALGIRTMEMPSGAGHDAMCFADICPTGMVFIPCRDGISHNSREYAELSDLCAGADVLLSFLSREI